MPVVRAPQRVAPVNPSARRPVRANPQQPHRAPVPQPPRRAPVLQPPHFPQQTDVYTEDMFDQPESYNYLPTTFLADQHRAMLTQYYSNRMPTSHYYPPQHQTLRRVTPTYPSIVYYNR